MGSNEISARSSEDSLWDIVEIKTPSPLTSTTDNSSDSSKSPLSDDEKFVRQSSNEEFSGFIDFRGKSKKLEENSSFSVETSDSSSPSSLKQRIRDFPSSVETVKFSDRLAALDRRIRRERDLYLQLHGLNDRIDEKDEGEASSSDEIVFTNLRTDSRGRKQENMCSSAPETTRLIDNESGLQRFSTTSDKFARGGTKKFDEPRPPKYLRPIEPACREIIRSNAPPLCLTDEKIVQMLRRGSASARQENLRKTTGKACVKLAAYGKPMGVIIKNLSSDPSEDENCTDDWIIRKPYGLGITKFQRDSGIPGDERQMEKTTNSVISEIPEKNKIFDDIQSIRSEMSIRDDARERNSRTIMERESRSRNNSTGEGNCQRFVDNSFVIPKLELTSRKNIRYSNSLASKDVATKKSFDVDELIRALSDVSIHRRNDRPILSADNGNFPIPESTTAHARTCAWLIEKNDLPKNDFSTTERNSRTQRSARWKNSQVTTDQTSSDNVCTKNRETTKISRKIENNHNTMCTTSMDSSMETSPRTLKSEISTKNYLPAKNNFQTFDSLQKTRHNLENIDRSMNRSERYSEPVTLRNNEKISHESSSSRDFIPSKLRNDVEVRGDARFEVCAKNDSSSEQENSAIIREKVSRTRNNDTQTSDRLKKSYSPSDEKHREDDDWREKKIATNNSRSQARFNIYQDTCENTPRSTFSIEKLKKTSLSPPPSRPPRASRLNKKFPRETTKCPSMKRSPEASSRSRNSFWADNSSDLSRAMASSVDSQIQDSENYNSIASKISSKIVSPSLTESSEDTPRHGSVDARRICKNHVTQGKENDFIERLSSTEIQQKETKNDKAGKHTETETLDSCEKKIIKTGRSESDIDVLRKTLDNSSILNRGKISSSLTRLKHSPEESKKISTNHATRRKSQDRFPFTIVNDAASSSKLKTEIIEQSEMAYRLKFHPNHVPSTNHRVEFTAEDFSRNPRVIDCEQRGKFVPKIRSFVGKLSRWRKFQKSNQRSIIGTKMRIIYENKECNDEAESSVRSTNQSTADSNERRCNRNGLWVVGLEDETKNNEKGRGEKKKFTRDDEKYDFNTRTIKYNEKDREIYDEHGCFCSRICRFLIGGNNYYYHRYSFTAPSDDQIFSVDEIEKSY